MSALWFTLMVTSGPAPPGRMDYRDFDDARSDDDDEPDHHAFNYEEELFQVIAEGHLHAYLNECGTQV